MIASCLHRLRTRKGGLEDGDADDKLPSARDALQLASLPELPAPEVISWPPHGEGRIMTALRACVREMRRGQSSKQLRAIPAKHRIAPHHGDAAAAAAADPSGEAGAEDPANDSHPTGRRGKSGPLSGATVRPTGLLTAIGQDYPMFRGRAQQDAHELLMCLLNGVEEEESRRLKTRADRRLRLVAAGGAPDRRVLDEGPAACPAPASALDVLRQHAGVLREQGGAVAETASCLEKEEEDGSDFHERVALTLGGGPRASCKTPLGLRGFATKTCLLGAARSSSSSSSSSGESKEDRPIQVPGKLARALMSCEAPRTPRPCTVVDDLFRGHYAQLSRCEHCGNLHVTVQDWLALEVPLAPPRPRRRPAASAQRQGAGSGSGSASGSAGSGSFGIHLSKRDKARLRRENDRRRKAGRPILGPDFKELPPHKQPKGTRQGGSGGSSGGMSRQELEMSSLLGLSGPQMKFLRKGQGSGGTGGGGVDVSPEARRARAAAAVRTIKPQPTESWLHFAKSKDKWSWLKEHADTELLDRYNINQPWKRLKKSHGGHKLDPIVQEAWQNLLREAGMLDDESSRSGDRTAGDSSKGADGSNQASSTADGNAARETRAIQEARAKATAEKEEKAKQDVEAAAARQAAVGLLARTRNESARRWASWDRGQERCKEVAQQCLVAAMDAASAAAATAGAATAPADRATGSGEIAAETKTSAESTNGVEELPG